MQELITPTIVEFFSQESVKLGYKIGLRDSLSAITGIAIEALEGKRLGYFSVEERFRWAENRKTTREEDAAYSLFGIFYVSMPVLYGEGRRKAMARLRDQIDESLDLMGPPLNCLGRGQQLLCGQYLTSQNEVYSLAFQHDGDFVLSGPSGILWSSHTAGRSASSVTMEYEGELTIHANDGSKIWTSATHEPARPRLMLFNDGNAAVQSLGKIIWATHTSGGRLPNSVDVEQKVYVNQPLMSENKWYTFVLQDDGNLVHRGPKGVLWSTNTGGRNDVSYFMLQEDGSLIVYKHGHRAIWGSQSFARNRPRLRVQNDGNVVIYSLGIAIWATNTRQ